MSKKTISIILLFIVLAFILVSCNIFDSEPNEKYISGVVKDSSGNPVTNAFLNFNFIFNTGVDTPTTLTGVNVAIGFSLQTKSKVKIILNNYLHQHLKTVIDDSLEEGSHGIVIEFTNDNGKDIYSDVFYYSIFINGNKTKEEKTYKSIAQHLSTNPLPFVKTDLHGKFSTPLSRFPYKETFLRTFGDDSITIRFSDTQFITAFTNERFGRTSFSLSHPNNIEIILNRSK